ncbi:MAG: hypothetical protein ABIZ95_00930, partial [Pyrinomonadaceae bacterium]
QRCIVLLFCFLLAAGRLAAQSTPTEKLAEGPTKEQQEVVKQQAQALLREVADEGGRMRLVQNRIFFQTTAANLLWESDDKTARNLFQFAMADVRALFTNPTDDDDDSKKYRRRAEAGSLRQSLLLSLATHDPKMARAFLRETHDLATAGGNEAYGPYGNDEQLEISLAMQIAQNDPDQALEMGRQTLSKGFSAQIFNLIEMINKKSPETAAKLTSETITKLKAANISEDREAASLAIMMFMRGAQLAESNSKEKDKEKKTTNLLDDAALRDLAEMITQAAMNPGTENYSLSSVAGMLNQLEKYAPARVKQLRRKAGTEAATGEQNVWAEFTRLREEGTVEELVQAASKPENASNAAMFYEAAVTKLITAGELDKARSLVNEKVPDADSKRRLLATIEQGALEQATSKGNLEESRRLLSGVKTNEERIMALTQLAMSISAKDKKSALILLEEASNLSTPRARNYRQLLARLALVRAYAPIDAEQGFAILETSVDQANELLAALFLLGEFIAEDEIVRDDEVTVFQLGRSTASEMQQYKPTVNALAQADFKRMKAVADRFQRSEIRLMARLLVAQSVLAADNDDPNGSNAFPTPPYGGPID